MSPTSYLLLYPAMWTAKIQQVLGLHQMRGEFSWILCWIVGFFHPLPFVVVIIEIPGKCEGKADQKQGG